MRIILTVASGLLFTATLVSTAMAQSSDDRHSRIQQRDDLRQERSLYDPRPEERPRARRQARQDADRFEQRRRFRRVQRQQHHRHGCKSRRAIIRSLRSADLHTHTIRRQGRHYYVIAHNSRKDRYDLRVGACKGNIIYIQRTKQVAKKGLKGLIQKWF